MAKAREPVQELIALAIKEADRSLFNEDYLKQAANVLSALKKAGYEVVPLKPSDNLIKYVDDNLPFGRHRPGEWLAQVYALMVENARRLEK